MFIILPDILGQVYLYAHVYVLQFSLTLRPWSLCILASAAARYGADQVQSSGGISRTSQSSGKNIVW